MAVVKGVKEKVHNPLYDSIFVRPNEQLSKTLTSNVLRFFQEVTSKNKLQTNMQAASLLPHWNTYEARALRVVISDLATQVPDTLTVTLDLESTKLIQFKNPIKLIMSISSFTDLKRDLGNDNNLEITKDTELVAREWKLTDPDGTPRKLEENETILITPTDLKKAQDRLAVLPPDEQIFPDEGFTNVISKFIYNTVTTFFVGEKIMIQVPTWFFPAGAGPLSQNGKVTTHGYPSSEATFRFAEPVIIDAQQNFRVEIEVPESDVLGFLRRLYGPLFIWVTLDGYMTRDVQ